MKIAVWYHTLFFLGQPPELRPKAVDITIEQMQLMQQSGLEAAADLITVGINGGEESADLAALCLPKKAQRLYHGLDCRNENLTITSFHAWAQLQKEEWFVLYFHAKGASHQPGESYGENVSDPWRRAMQADLIGNWKTAVAWLSQGADIVCSHWLWNMADGTQHIPAGNFLFTRSSFVASLPSMFLRDRIKVSGIKALESRYESEVFWGNGRRPKVMQFRPHGGGGVP